MSSKNKLEFQNFWISQLQMRSRGPGWDQEGEGLGAGMARMGRARTGHQTSHPRLYLKQGAQTQLPGGRGAEGDRHLIETWVQRNASPFEETNQCK